MVFALTACKNGKSPAVEDASVELTVYAAASLTETLTKAAELYRESAPNVTFTFTFDSSGTLKTQIAEGADCDIFISAAQKQMNEMDITSDKNTAGLDFVDSSTRFNIVENKVVLVVPDNNPAGIASFDDIATKAVSLLAIGNSDVPVGQYAQEVLINMGIFDRISEKITYGSNVKELTTWVGENTVDCGIVYATDAYSAGLQVIAEAPEGMLNTPVLYPAAVLKTAKNPGAAKAFLDFLKTDACAAVFQEVGFSVPG
jgi:molybdate transport system substrate-binding protein